MVLSSRKYDPGCSSRIRIPDPDPDFLPIPDPGSRGKKGTGSRIRIRIRNTGKSNIHPLYFKKSVSDPDQDPGGQKLPTIIEKKIINFMFSSAECSLLRVEGFSCSLDVRYGGQGLSNL
jgi:hypothetical protein